MANVTIELKKNYDHIIGSNEFSKKYNLEHHKILIMKDITTAIEEYQDSQVEIADWEQEEIENLQSLVAGNYSLNVGDYTYYITIDK